MVRMGTMLPYKIVGKHFMSIVIDLARKPTLELITLDGLM
jgi:hypothetical protein